MSPMPTHMRDRWRNRTEPAVGYGTVYWHVLMRDHPEAIAAVAEAQATLAAFPGFHLPPREWIRMTTCIAGSTTEISRDQMRAMLSHAQEALHGAAPAEVTVGRILYHPEAIMLAVEPRETLLPVLNAVADATEEIAHLEVSENRRSAWTPHTTVAYSVSEQDVEPIAAALGPSVQPRSILIDTVTLIVQWGPERTWDWEPIGQSTLGGDRTAVCACATNVGRPTTQRPVGPQEPGASRASLQNGV